MSKKKPEEENNNEVKDDDKPQPPPQVEQQQEVQVLGLTPILHSRVMKALRKAPHEAVEELIVEFSAKNLPLITLKQDNS